MNPILYLVLTIIQVFTGSFFLGDAVLELSRKHYYRFGWSAFLAVWSAFNILTFFLTRGGIT